MSFADALCRAVEEKGNPCLVGLDPHLALLPREFAAAHDPEATRAERARDVEAFLGAVIDLVAEHVPAVKPQSAFFEVLGPEGAAAWERVVARAHDAGLLVIGDVKRGDIGSTAAAYAEAYLGAPAGADPRSACDAITLNPLLGTDSIEPFLATAREHGRGLFVLVRTSNPSSAEFQDHGDPRLSERIAAAVERWGEPLRGREGWSSVGAVIGATHPGELARLRVLLPHAPILLPGYGAQGGRASDIVAAFRGIQGGLVNSSRAILFAKRSSERESWKDASLRALHEMVREIRTALGAGR